MTVSDKNIDGGKDMTCRKAQVSDAKAVTDIAQRTIETIYPRYYPKEVVAFFVRLHCYENVLKDIQKNNVYVLEVKNVTVGTGSFEKNHVTRVYVLPEHQGKGYGSYILRELENAIRSFSGLEKYDNIFLDASLPACRFYERYGYRTARHEECQCDKGVVLVYDVMEKRL